MTAPETPGKSDRHEPGKPRRKPFGQVAIDMGFVTADQVKQALDIQHKEDAAGKTHRLLGIIMLGEGYLSSEELIQMLRHYQAERKQKLLDVIKKDHKPGTDPAAPLCD